MGNQREALAALRLSPRLLGLVAGDWTHAAWPTVCRPVRKEWRQPEGDEFEGFVPLWEDANGSDQFCEVVYAKRGADGPEFWSAIYEEGDAPCVTLLAHSEQGLLFWLFYWFLVRQEDEPSAADWDLPALAGTLGFRHLGQVLKFRQACEAGEDDEDRFQELVKAVPEGPPDDSDAVEQAMAEGEYFADLEKHAEALVRFQSAWDLLPEPKAEQEPVVRIMASIADCHFHLQNWEACHDAMQHALRCGAALDNPFVRLRLGQSLYELGNEREAANWLVPVYLTEGRGPFANDDPKYLEFFRRQLRPPQGGWPKGW